MDDALLLPCSFILSLLFFSAKIALIMIGQVDPPLIY